MPETPKETENAETIKNSVDKEAGSLKIGAAVFVFMLVVLVLVIGFFFKVLKDKDDEYNRLQHSAEEQNAYRYAEQRTKLNQTKAACDNNTQKHQATIVWINQQNYKTKPPPDISTDMPCEKGD